MKLSQVKAILKDVKTISFQLPDNSLVPSHFHVTEVGEITKRFIDCGGTVRKETVVNFQLWNANDYDHRLHPEKLLNFRKKPWQLKTTKLRWNIKEQPFKNLGWILTEINFY